MARILACGFHVARPLPDVGVDLAVLSQDYARAVPVQVKTARTPSFAFRRAWFRPVDVVLVLCWLVDPGPRFFVFDGLAEVERFLGASTQTESWRTRGLWSVSAAGPSHEAALAGFEDAFATVLARRLGQTALPPWDRRASYRLTTHARQRIDAGEVQEAWIAEVLTQPEIERSDPTRPGVTLSWRRIAAAGGRSLRVAHRRDNDQILVITAFLDRGATP